MRVWHNDIERDAWVESNCDRCFQPDEAAARMNGQHGCPHLTDSLDGNLPEVWTRRRNALMGQTYRCSEFLDKPPSTRRRSAPADTLPMFDVEAAPYTLVPVEEWPEIERKSREGEHS